MRLSPAAFRPSPKPTIPCRPGERYELETKGRNTENPPVQFRKATLIGVGMLGGSFGLALRKRRLARNVTGFVRRARSVRECVAHGAVDEATLDLAEAVHGADLVILCTPLAQMKSLAKRLAPHLERGALVTDVGSVKASVVRDVELVVSRAGAHFVASHPMAGSEKAGVLAARADLFADAICIITPTKKTQPDALKRTEQLWKALGSRLLKMTPAMHDQLVSRSSHLPYLSSVALTNCILDPAHSTTQGLLCAGGFRDTTRIASSSPEMWRDIALANRRYIRQALASYLRQLVKLDTMLKHGEGDRLAACFQKAKTLRDAWFAEASPRLPK